MPPHPHTSVACSHSFAISTKSHSCPLDSVGDFQLTGLRISRKISYSHAFKKKR